MNNKHAVALFFATCFCFIWAPNAAAKPKQEAKQDQAESETVLDNFDDAKAAAKRWITVNDNVMGGRSKGGPSFADGLLRFTGSTNTNGGGFSSVRTVPADHDLTGHAGLLLRVKGDGRTYKASFRTDVTNGRWKIPFRADFETVDGQWQTVFIPFEAFKPTFFGREIRKNPPALDLAKVQSLGLMIYDKQDGAFKLSVDWIKAVPQPPKADESS